MDALFSFLFGPYAPLARHIFHTATTYIFILFCLYVVKSVLEALFPLTDTAATVLHFIDNYAALLGLIGFVVWVTIDIASLLRHRFQTNGPPDTGVNG